MAAPDLARAFVEWLAQTPWSVSLHESQYAYTFIETAHVLGITLFVGTIAMVDLRLLGAAWRAVPVSQMSARTLPWTVVGFVLMTATGIALFYAIPVRTWYSLWFRVKVILLAAGAVNIWIFHRRVERDRAAWDEAPAPPLAARISAAVSLIVWAGVIVTGRMIAYNWFDCDKPLAPLVRAFTGCPVGGID
jgi:hypothetical protein